VNIDFSGVFSSMGLVFNRLWPLVVVPLAVLVGFALVKWIRWLFVFRAGIEKRRTRYL
jgi:hypothetical protein